MHFLHDTIFFLDKEMKKNNIGKANKEIETPTKNPKNTTTENEISKEYKKKSLRACQDSNLESSDP